ncbi:DUF4174 domain-containing protein [Flammeovirga sp. EKP202]|uniref:DUF4174 domain-containing protein n=1 Tax=Flammeovirga sp. EKP202 TaxID=2770592 RepID=UPI00165F7D7B|nr:DUF4174 domain-containing protein [Flammeovirga sp. EKP202]MBD0405039.1 DUF4174 domain-containing protein [Flammeovirga sp. EKP202]
MSFKILISFSLFLFVSVSSFGQDLSSYKWKNRLLIIHTSDSSNKRYQQQLTEFKEDPMGLSERKIVLITIVNQHYSIQDFSSQQKRFSMD